MHEIGENVQNKDLRGAKLVCPEPVPLAQLPWDLRIHCSNHCQYRIESNWKRGRAEG